MNQKITALKAQKRNPNRVNVYLDGNFAFGVARIVAAWLNIGQELSPEKVASLHNMAAWKSCCAGASDTKPLPSLYSLPFVNSCWTVIRFWVRVPVLSVQIVSTEPSDSTTERFRTTAPLRAICLAPSARANVSTIAGSRG